MRVCVGRASPCGASVGGDYTRAPSAFGVCAPRTSVCARVLDGGPGPARRSRPVPSRSVEYRAAPRRSPPAIHSSFSQPARPTDCQCPTARRTVCTQKRSGSPSLPPYRPPRSYALASALRRHPTSPFLVTHGHPPSSPSLPLRFCLPFSLALHTRARTHTHTQTHTHTHAYTHKHTQTHTHTGTRARK